MRKQPCAFHGLQRGSPDPKPTRERRPGPRAATTIGDSGDDDDGFFGLTSDDAISEVRLQMTPKNNDGFGRWRFAALIVPLPSATAMGGIGLLADATRRRRG